MADDKTKTGQSDRSRVAGGEGYEVGYFARMHGITRSRRASSLRASATTAPRLMRRRRS